MVTNSPWGATEAKVKLIDLDGEFDVAYERPGKLTRPYPWNSTILTLSVSLDRTNYPQNTGVVVTIDDHGTERGSDI